MTRTILTTFCLNFVVLTASSGLTVAQSAPEITQAAQTAAEYIINDYQSAYSLPAPARILVDVESTEGFSTQGNPIPADVSAGAAAVADLLGARRGRLADIISCRAGTPTPEEIMNGIGRCSLAEDTDLVIQFSTPRPSNNGRLISVALWVEVKDDVGTPKYVSVHSQQVGLIRGSEGQWTATKVLRESYGHY